MKKIIFSMTVMLVLYGYQAVAEENEGGYTTTIDEVSVTATRIKRKTQDVPSTINVIGKDRIESEQMFNIKDAIRGTPGVLIESKSNSYSTRLIIRGAGLKARYGVREIMVLRDGVPMTDPDSFSRFDYIDTQDIESIEITKGPGSLYGSGSAGGTIQILSKSVLENDNNHIKIGAGQHGQKNINFRKHFELNENQALAITGSHRQTDNNWRDWNKFDTQQIGIKHGMEFDSGATLESEIAFTKADLQLPTSMTEAEFEIYKRTGEQRNTSRQWQHSGRYSNILFINSKYEKEFNSFTFRPRFYFNRWDHFHPVTGAINDNPGTDVMGVDLEFVKKLKFWGDTTLIGGTTYRIDKTDGSKKYKYADLTTKQVCLTRRPPFTCVNKIVRTNSDRKGGLLSTEDSKNTLQGVFMQISMRPTKKLLFDVGFRYDRMNFDVTETEYGKYDYGKKIYVDYATPNVLKVDKTYNLFSPKIGVSYALSDVYSLYGSLSRGGQLPSESEIQSAVENGLDLDEAISNSFEIGLKARSNKFSFDLALYQNNVEDDIIQVISDDGYSTVYQNAAKTQKRGVEFSGSLILSKSISMDLSYAYSDYKFKDFIEAIREGRNMVGYDRSGNHLPYIPKHQYSIAFAYKHQSGFYARIQGDTWGSYYTDNDNLEKYDGYKFLTNLTLGYKKGQHSIKMNINNLFDKRYATEVKNSGDDKTYSAGAPRSAMLTYNYNFD